MHITEKQNRPRVFAFPSTVVCRRGLALHGIECGTSPTVGAPKVPPPMAGYRKHSQVVHIFKWRSKLSRVQPAHFNLQLNYPTQMTKCVSPSQLSTTTYKRNAAHALSEKVLPTTCCALKVRLRRFSSSVPYSWIPTACPLHNARLREIATLAVFVKIGPGILQKKFK